MLKYVISTFINLLFVFLYTILSSCTLYQPHSEHIDLERMCISQCENYAIVKKSQFQYGITGDIGMVCGNTSLRIVASVEEDKYCIFGR